MKSVTGLMKRLSHARANEKGFTLIELIIVIAIIGILVAIAIPVYGAIQGNAKQKTVDSLAKNGMDMTMGYAAENGMDVRSDGTGGYLVLESNMDTLEAAMPERFAKIVKTEANEMEQDFVLKIEVVPVGEGMSNVCVSSAYLKGVDFESPDLDPSDIAYSVQGGDFCKELLGL